MHPILSIIIPVYNVEKHLVQCLESVLAQTLKRIEVICINDASTDKSFEILEKFQRKDNRVKLMTTGKKGQGTARNKGIEAARGEYIGFVDADDTVDTQMFEKLYHTAVHNKADVAMCFPHCFENLTNEPKDVYYFSRSEKILSLQKRETVYAASEVISLLPYIPVVPWNKIYKAALIRECNAHFAEGIMHEDFLFYLSVILHTSRIVLLNEKHYRYRINSGNSLSTKRDEQTFSDIPKIFSYIETKLPELSNSILIRNQYDLFKLTHLIAWCNQLLRNDMDHKKQLHYLNSITGVLKIIPMHPSLSFLEKLQYLFIKKKQYRLFRFKVWMDQIPRVS